MRFAFYGRVSTEDQQDPESSRAWQLTRAQALTDTHGEITAEYFDIGQSRSIPWKRRHQASQLLEDLRNPTRGFNAVVIGEPHRAFYGNQFSLTFPVFEHYGVGLWVPEVGGPVDPTSEAHDLIMSVFGGMSKGERNRIKIRVRSAMAAQAKVEGRYLGGRPPYGYQLADAGPHPNPAKAADGKRLHILARDPVTAPVVERIFTLYLNGMGIFLIAQTLTGEGILSPSAYDPARNRHRSGKAWSKSAVQAILTNPRYTGHQVWNKQRRAETLLDVNDVALGYETKLTWNNREQWIWSDRPTHPAIIDAATFTAAGQRLARRGPTSERLGPRNHHPYVLRSLMVHQQCGRRMQGNWNHGRAHYRCRYPQEYAVANSIDHPLAVYIREDAVLPALDGWLATAFAPARVEENLAALDVTQPHISPEIDVNRAIIADCDRKLARHRAALEAGADPTLVTVWIADVQAEQANALAALQRVAPSQVTPRRRLTRQKITELVNGLGGLLAALHDADPIDKAEVYRQLGLRLTYDHETETVLAEATPRSSVDLVYVSEGGLEPPRP